MYKVDNYTLQKAAEKTKWPGDLLLVFQLKHTKDGILSFDSAHCFVGLDHMDVYIHVHTRKDDFSSGGRLLHPICEQYTFSAHPPLL